MASSSATRHHAYSRKQKSLGLLCSNFLKLYDRGGVESIGLDEAAVQLGVERRRIYDIVNVLESVGVLSRKAKNRYSWKGFEGIPQALEDLKKEVLGENFGNAFVNSCDSAKDSFDDGDDEKPLDLSCDETREENSSQSSLHTGASFCNFSSKIKTDARREKSLGLLTRNFVKLFLTTNVDTVSLDEAARLLLGDAHGSSMMRNNSAAKVRRLYDIANVLSSVNLLEKTQQTETKKPAFRWLGFNGKPDNYATEFNKSPNPKLFKKREFGSDITNLDFVKRSRLISPLINHEDESAQRHLHQMKDCQQEKQQPNSKGYVFGPFRPVLPDAEKKSLKTAHDWDNLASSYRLQYHNQALSELFSHYMEAWKSWYMEVAQVNNLQPKRNAIQQPL